MSRLGSILIERDGFGSTIRCSFNSLIVCVVVAFTSTVFAPNLAAQVPDDRYLAFGDSITFGVGDDLSRGELNIGYPPRLEESLTNSGASAEVRNEGLPGETTAEGLSRLPGVIGDANVLLLMEGTNDVNARLSNETIVFNLDQLARTAENQGLEAIHATIIPRLASANFDGGNRVARALNGGIRDLAWSTSRRLVDPFEGYVSRDGGFDDLIVGGSDKIHPNSDGYDLMAGLFLDLLTDVDSVAPVTGLVFPEDDAQNVPGNSEIQIDLYDFGQGIDVNSVALSVNGQPVAAVVSGDSAKLEIRYQPPQPFTGVVIVNLDANDSNAPANSRSGQVVQFVIQGTQFAPGDVDRDGRVDGSDLVAFALRFGAVRGQTRYRGFADLNGDDVIDGLDLAILANNFGQTAS